MLLSPVAHRVAAVTVLAVALGLSAFSGYTALSLADMSWQVSAADMSWQTAPVDTGRLAAPADMSWQ
ncbi:hypothetical protein ACFFKE_27750 [Streptomyces mutabilis]|uniref:hypothetical protein n=1 Tax=Streptomyces mutabilis TaxID=67332 RepID=UPI0017803ACF|nr:hypothetical protein [Streptomyces mutabilis]GGQ50305.1 hypothetical protein GCM10010279_69450 [Streptomyces mutabilis]